MSPWCLTYSRWLQWLDYSRTAGPIHSELCPNGYVSDAQLITMDVTVPEWRKLALFDMPHVYNCIKTAICIHYIKAAVMLTINVLLYMMWGWWGILVQVENMQSQPNFWLSLSIRSMFSMCPSCWPTVCISFGSMECLNNVILNGNYVKSWCLWLKTQCIVMEIMGLVCGVQRLAQSRDCTALSSVCRQNGRYWRETIKQVLKGFLGKYIGLKIE